LAKIKAVKEKEEEVETAVAEVVEIWISKKILSSVASAIRPI
jgi:hypothetical protein